MFVKCGDGAAARVLVPEFLLADWSGGLQKKERGLGLRKVKAAGVGKLTGLRNCSSLACVRQGLPSNDTGANAARRQEQEQKKKKS